MKLLKTVSVFSTMPLMGKNLNWDCYRVSPEFPTLVGKVSKDNP